LSQHLESCAKCQQVLDQLSDSGLLGEYRSIIRKRAAAIPALGLPARPGDLGSLEDLAIEEVIGRGGMGVVLRGRDLRLGREVAIKFLLPGSSPESEKRFIREARAVAALKHENIVPVYHIGQNAEGQDYIVSPLISGQTLRARLQTSLLEPKEAAEVVRQMTDALASAHAAGLIHRDVKPSNILLDRVDRRAKITDFGLARAIEDATLTQADMLCGTPEYMSPEQVTLGDRIDGRSDIYSLGVTLYECLTGTTPFRGRPLEVIDQHRVATPLAPSKLNRLVPTDLETICLKAMSKEADGRYQTMQEFGDDLRRFLAGEPILAKPATSIQKFQLWCRRNPRLALALTSTLGSLLLGTIVSSLLWLQSSANAMESQKLAVELSGQQKQLQAALESSESQRVRAEKRFDELRKLANELLFEIYPKVEFLENSLDARRGIVTSALGYLNGLHSEASGDVELQAELATAYEKVGELFGMIGNSQLGDKDAGLENYRKAQLLRQAVLEADPRNPKSLERLAHNHYVIARTLWMRDEVREAEKTFQTGLELQREFVELEPSDLAWNKLATMLIDYAAIPAWEGQNDLATPLFDEARKILESLIERDPKNGEYKKTMTRMLRAESSVHISRGDVTAGEESLLCAISLGDELLALYPNDFPVTRSVWMSKFKLGEFYIRNKIVNKVVSACQAAIDFPRAVLEKEPNNAMVAVDMANSYFNLARAYRLNDDFTASVEQAQNALDVMQKLADTHPGDKEYQRNVAIYLIEIARSRVQLKEYSEVLAPIDRAIAIVEPLSATETGSQLNKYDLSVATRIAAQAHHHLGNRDEALAAVETSIRLTTELRDAGALAPADDQLLQELTEEKEAFSKPVDR
jgi:serine/threonine protein kinase